MLDEVPTSDLVEEIKRRSECSIIMMTIIGDSGERVHNYYSDGDIMLQLGLVEAQKSRVMSSLVPCDLDDED